MKVTDYGSDLGHVHKNKVQNLEIPPLNIQQQIINKINLLNEQSSHYNTYA